MLVPPSWAKGKPCGTQTNNLMIDVIALLALQAISHLIKKN
jgi:hypothetical protein